MLLGIGYLPRLTGASLWRSFDPAEIKDELAHIAALGFQAVRAPLFWADFQPEIERIETRALDALAHFLDIAHEQGLCVQAGLWTGMWDGALWWPDWGLNPAPLPPVWPLIVNQRRVRWGRLRHPFIDERMLAAREALLNELAAQFGKHPALHSWEPLPGFGRLAAALSPEKGLAWLAESMALLRQKAPAQSVAFLLALDSLESAAAIWPDEVKARGGRPCLSVAAFASDRRRLPLSAYWIAFAIDLFAALAEEPPSIYLAGLPTTAPGEHSVARDGIYYASEEEGAAFLADVLALARERECPELWLWRWADIPENRWHEPPYDRSLWRRFTGLVRGDGREKELVKGLHSARRKSFPKLDVDVDEYRLDPKGQFDALWRRRQQMRA
ncbi:MAG: hypothetical protein GXP42_12380 [Chloroflexi bacterium]|nr:hypothetical protein [Chloroflexota bacterium]